MKPIRYWLVTLSSAFIVLCVTLTSSCTTQSQAQSIESWITPGRELDDRLLNQAIFRKLNQEFRQRDYRAQLDLVVFNGRVFLLGSVFQETHKKLIEDMVSDFRHVKSVHNELHVGALRDRRVASSDARIRTQVRLALLGDPRTRAEDFQIHIHKGAVYLIGLVPRAVGDAAADLIKYIPNVEQVVIMLEYLD